MTQNNSKRSPLVAAIAGAKGGVGKSMVTSNLGIQFAKEGLKVIILDLDLGASNQHTLFGISRSCRSWVNFLQGSKEPLSNFLTSTKQENLSVLPASGFIPEVAAISAEMKAHLISEIKALDADVVLLDLGAGSHKDTLDFFSLADLKIIVTTAEQTALMNNFEFIKNIVYQLFLRLYKGYPHILPLLEKYKLSPKMSVDDLILKIQDVDPWLAENLKLALESLSISIVFNQIKRIEEAKFAIKLKRIAKNQLGIDLKYPGFVFYSEEISASIQKMQPLSFISPNTTPSQIFKRMARALLLNMKDEKTATGPITLAWDQLKKDFYKNRVDQKKAKLSH